MSDFSADREDQNISNLMFYFPQRNQSALGEAPKEAIPVGDWFVIRAVTMRNTILLRDVNQQADTVDTDAYDSTLVMPRS